MQCLPSIVILAQAVRTNEILGDKDDQLKQQAANLQDFDVYKSDYKRVQLK